MAKSRVDSVPALGNGTNRASHRIRVGSGGGQFLVVVVSPPHLTFSKPPQSRLGMFSLYVWGKGWSRKGLRPTRWWAEGGMGAERGRLPIDD